MYPHFILWVTPTPLNQWCAYSSPRSSAFTALRPPSPIAVWCSLLHFGKPCSRRQAPSYAWDWLYIPSPTARRRWSTRSWCTSGAWPAVSLETEYIYNTSFHVALKETLPKLLYGHDTPPASLHSYKAERQRLDGVFLKKMFMTLPWHHKPWQSVQSSWKMSAFNWNKLRSRPRRCMIEVIMHCPSKRTYRRQNRKVYI